MFTGIIEGLGTIAEIRTAGEGKQMTVEAGFDLAGTRIGDSIAVNGACLTAIRIAGRRFSVDVSPETLGVSTLGDARAGDRVNLERALKLSDRLDGHLVSGHIDGKGQIRHIRDLGRIRIIEVAVAESILRYTIQKGSVAIDGVSLTINDCDKSGFSVSIIPHTAAITTIGEKKAGDRVNIETDLIGKYIERFIQKKPADPKKSGKDSSIDMDFLAKTGFL